MDIIMDVSMESSSSSWTQEEKKFAEPRRKLISPTMMATEDSGYLSGSHDSEPRLRYPKRSWQQTEIQRSPEDMYWCNIVPERLSTPSRGLVEHKYVDLLLRLRNYPHLLQKVLSELKPDDLVRCCLVSKAWNQVCKLDHRATKRRRAYLACKGLKDKENLGLPDAFLPSNQERGFPVPRLFTSTPLAPIATSRQLNFCHMPLLSPDPPSQVRQSVAQDRFSVFMEAGRMLTPGKGQMPCPRCSLPSRVDRDINVGQCTRSHCRFQFCLVCLCEQHTKTNCPVTQLSTVKWPRSLTSRSSRRNLRRL